MCGTYCYLNSHQIYVIFSSDQALQLQHHLSACLSTILNLRSGVTSAPALAFQDLKPRRQAVPLLSGSAAARQGHGPAGPAPRVAVPGLAASRQLKVLGRGGGGGESGHQPR